MAEPLYVFARALTLFGIWLDKVSPIPWPLGIAALLPIYAVSLSVCVWWMRGTILPLPCGYPYPPPKKGGCRRPVAGEWHKCWYHGRRRHRKTDRHDIQHNLRRWEELDRNSNRVERSDAWGYGFLRLRSRNVTLLYYKGYAKPIGDVWKFRKDFYESTKRRWRLLQKSFDKLRQGEATLRSLLRFPRVPAQPALSDKVPTIIKATRATLSLATVGLLLTMLSVFLGVGTKHPTSYASALAFVTSGACALEGIWRREHHWIRLSLADTAKWYGSFLSIAVIGGLIDMAGRTLGAA